MVDEVVRHLKGSLPGPRFLATFAGQGSTTDPGRCEGKDTMAVHDVRFSANGVRVTGIDFQFDVKIDGKVRGSLYVSEGDLQWRPKHGQYSIPIPWDTFAKWAES